MIRNLFLIVIILLLFSCKDNKNRNHKLIKEIKSLDIDNVEITKLLKKNNIENPSNIILYDPNYYYLLSKLFYIRNIDEKYNIWFNYFINNALKTDNIFKDNALKLYIAHLIKNNKWDLIKKTIIDNQKILLDSQNEIYLKYADNKSFNEINYIPDNIEILPILYQIIRSNPSDLTNLENQLKIENFLINSKLFYNYIYTNNKIENDLIDIDLYIDHLDKMINYVKDNYFLSCIFYYIKNDKNKFRNNLEDFIKTTDQISYQKLNILRKLSINLGIRKDFYYILSSHYNEDKYLKYFYGIEVIYFINYSKGLSILKETLHDFNANGTINYNIRAMILESTFILNEKWFNELIKFYNDYPDSINANNLLYIFFRKLIMYQKNDLLIDLFKNFPLEKMGAKDKELFTYYLYLIDDDNREKWKKLIIKEFPLSFSGLKINHGKILISNKNRIKNIIAETKLSNIARIKLLKIKYLLDFDFIEDAKNISLNDLSTNEKIIIYDLFYNYSVNINDYYNSLRYTRLIIDLLYDSNYYKIDDLDILKRLYPSPYLNLVNKYSKIYDVDPACAYAVMREESNFKNDIVSYKNAIGLMQIMPSTGQFISQKLKLHNYDLTNPEDNIKMGTYYLKFLERYFDKKEYILASYNAGPGRAKQWHSSYKNFSDDIKLELIPIYETRDYIRKVMQSYFIYNYLIEYYYNAEKL